MVDVNRMGNEYPKDNDGHSDGPSDFDKVTDGTDVNSLVAPNLDPTGADQDSLAVEIMMLKVMGVSPPDELPSGG